MFAALASILSPNQSLDLSITLTADGSMKVIVKPQLVKGSNVSLAIPLALAATPQELDTDFVGSLMQYAGQRTSLQQQVEVTSTIIAEAKATEVSKASKAISKSGTKPAANRASEAGDDHDDNDDNDDNGNGTHGGDEILGDAPSTSTTTPAPSAPAAQQAPAAAASNDDLLSALM